MEIVGSLGVAVLLGAFLANLVGWLGSESRSYAGLNAVGAAVAAYASWGIGFMPFVVLEAVWCAVAVVSLVRRSRAGGNEPM